jgi:hypothetical protein
MTEKSSCIRGLLYFSSQGSLLNLKDLRKENINSQCTVKWFQKLYVAYLACELLPLNKNKNVYKQYLR